MILFISTILFSTIFVSKTGLAAMDPAEIARINADAPYHIIGEVTTDEFVEETTKEEDHPRQLRKMWIEVSDVIKAPNGLEENNIVEVFYHYIPSWDAHSYVGGARMDIAENDVIEIWLVEGDNGWRPALSGDSINHIIYNEDRNDHISEPFWHAIQRKLANLDGIQTDVFVLIGLVIVLGIAIYRGLRKTA
jgi:hypothetical protein